MPPASRKAPARTGRGGTKKIGGVDVPGDPLLDCESHPPSKLFPVSVGYRYLPPSGLYQHCPLNRG